MLATRGQATDRETAIREDHGLDPGGRLDHALDGTLDRRPGPRAVSERARTDGQSDGRPGRE